MSTATIGQLTLTLREAENRRLTKLTDKMIEKNLELSGPGNAVMGFIHRGLSYRHTDAPLGALAFKVLHDDLTYDMDVVVAARKDLDARLQTIRQALLPIARLAVEPQDLRDGLPECLARMLPELADLPRTREPGWMLEQGSRAHTNFLEVTDDIDYFAAARLLF